MKTFFNFTTGKSINPLENIKYFYTNPYMPENMRLLNLAEKLGELTREDIAITFDEKGHIVTLFPIDMLIKGDVMIDWRTQDSFCINGKMWCKITGDDKDFVRVDTIRF